MADDELAWLEGMLGAASKDDQPPDMEGARCPKCNASDWAKIADLYFESIVRIEAGTGVPGAVHDGGLTDLEVVRKFSPPKQGSAPAWAVGVGVPLGAGAYYAYKRFGELPGQGAAIAAIVITVIVLMTRARALSDKHYHARRRWNRKYMCRKCGQLVAA